MKKIDSHVHITRDGSWFGTSHDASVERLLSEMDRANVETAALIPVVGQDNRDYVIEVSQAYPGRFCPGFLIEGLNESELEKMKEYLLSGIVKFIKVHPRMTGILPADPGLTPFLEMASRQGIAVVFCTYMRGPKLPMLELAPLVYDTIARRHSNLNIVLAHAGTYRALDALAVAQSHPNVYMDVSHVFSYFQGSSLIQDMAYIMRKLDRKLMFGSDFPEVDVTEYVNKVSRILDDIQDFEADLFFSGTAEKLFKL